MLKAYTGLDLADRRHANSAVSTSEAAGRGEVYEDLLAVRTVTANDVLDLVCLGPAQGARTVVGEQMETAPCPRTA